MTIRQQQLKIDRSKMMQSSKTNKDIEALRAKECVDKELQLIGNSQYVEQTANNIADI